MPIARLQNRIEEGKGGKGKRREGRTRDAKRYHKEEPYYSKILSIRLSKPSVNTPLLPPPPKKTHTASAPIPHPEILRPWVEGDAAQGAFGVVVLRGVAGGGGAC